MTNRSDIVDGTDPKIFSLKAGLIYTCNGGWIDLGHLNPYSARPEIGAANLWRQVSSEAGTLIDPKCAPPPPLGGLLGAAHHALLKPASCDTDPRYLFPGGQTGYPVRYRQDSASLPLRPGREGRFVVRHGLTVDEKKSVALAIFVQISLRFEQLQLFAESLGIGKSGFSQEDLVSDLIGFYIGVGEVAKPVALRALRPVSAKTALGIWDREGAVGDNKNYSFSPQMANKTFNGPPDACCDECAGASRMFPKMFTRIKPALKCQLFRDLPPF